MTERADQEAENEARPVEPDSMEQDQPVSDEGAAGEGERSELEAELLNMREALLRTRAEMENLRKRGERELDKARRFANESVLKDLVPVLDTLDQALENSAEDAGDQFRGLALLKKQLLQNLERHGLQVVDPLGEPFDPDWHEAMSLQPSAEHEPDTVTMVLQRGYTLNGRLLRAARVIVSKAAAE